MPSTTSPNPIPIPDPDAQPASYGGPARNPSEWLRAELRHWPKETVRVRGKAIQMRYQILGPFVRDGFPEVSLFLIVVKGVHRLVGKKMKHYQHKGPSFYLVSAVQRNGGLVLPFSATVLLSWLWQRWEIEVAHR